MNSIFDNINEQRAAIQAQRSKLDEQAAKLDQLETLARQLFPYNAAATPVRELTLTNPPAAPSMTKREQIYSTVESILSDGVRRSTKELESLLQARGVQVGGTDPVNNLSAYLSGTPAKARFESDRKKGGWMVIPAPKKANPRDVSPSQGFFSSTVL